MDIKISPRPKRSTPRSSKPSSRLSDYQERKNSGTPMKVQKELQSQILKLASKYEFAKSELKTVREELQSTQAECDITKQILTKIQMESKYSADRGQTLESFNNQLHYKLSQLEKEKNEAEAMLSDNYQQNEKLRDHNSVLCKALDIKVEHYNIEEISSAVLYEIGQAKAVSQNFDMNLKKKQIEINDLKSQLQMALTKIEELLIIKEQLNKELDNAENENMELQKSSRSMKESSYNENVERKALSKLINELKVKNQQLERDYESFLAKYAAKDEYISNIEEQLTQTKSLQEELQLKYDHSVEIIQTMDLGTQETHQSWQMSTLEPNKSSIADIQEQAEYWESQYKKAAAQLTTIHIARDESEKLLKQRMEQNLVQIQEIVDENDELKDTMNEAINQCTESLESQKKIEKEKVKQAAEVKSLKNSKLILEKTLQSQIEVLRLELDSLKEENATLKENNRR